MSNETIEEKIEIIETNSMKSEYIQQIQLFEANSFKDAQSFCSTGYVIHEKTVCNNEDGKGVYVCYSVTNDASDALFTIDGTNNQNQELKPIVEIMVSEKEDNPGDWEEFADFETMLPNYTNTRRILIKRAK